MVPAAPSAIQQHQDANVRPDPDMGAISRLIVEAQRKNEAGSLRRETKAYRLLA
jgi:hypothetical protein